MSLYDKINVGIGPGFGSKAGKLYSLKPTDGTADFNSTRALDSATSIDSDGLIVPFVADYPRDYNDGVGCSVLLTEPLRINTLTYSEEFDNAAWVKSEATVDPNVTTAPDGNLTADLLVEDATNAEHQIVRFNVWDTTERTATCFVKSTNRNFYILNGSANSNGVYFNLLNGTIDGENGTMTGKITAFPNGWYRCEATYTAGASQTLSFGMYITFTGSQATTGIYTGDGVSGVFIWGAQLEQGSYPTTYIKTAASSVTRNEDSIIGEADSKNYDSSKGILYAQISALSEDGNRYIGITDGGAFPGNSVYFGYLGAAITAHFFVGGVDQFDYFNAQSTVNLYIKFALYWEQGNKIELWVDGLNVKNENSFTVFPLGVLDRITYEISTREFKGKTNELWYSPDTTADIENYTAYESLEEIITYQKYTAQ